MLPIRSLTAVLVAAAVGTGLGAGLPAGSAAAQDDNDRVREFVEDYLDPRDTRAGQWTIGAFRLRDAHRRSRGYGVTVGVIGSGVDARNPNLEHNLLAGWDAYGERGGGGTTDSLGRGSLSGTAAASIVAGHGWGPGRANGVLGVAPAAKILSADILPPLYRLSELDRRLCPDLARAVRWLVTSGADIITISVWAGECPEVVEALELARDWDVTVVAGAGDGYDLSLADIDPGRMAPRFPARHETVIAVAGADRNLSLHPESRRGAEITVLAPSEDMLAAYPYPITQDVARGTATASAFTAGVLALIKSRWPEIGRADLLHRLAVTAAPVPSCPHGCGNGLVDPLAAVTAEVEPVDPADDPYRYEVRIPPPDDVPPVPAAAPSPQREPEPAWREPLYWLVAILSMVLMLVRLYHSVVAARGRRTSVHSPAASPTNPPD